jgi:hypothetical protein
MTQGTRADDVSNRSGSMRCFNGLTFSPAKAGRHVRPDAPTVWRYGVSGFSRTKCATIWA